MAAEIVRENEAVKKYLGTEDSSSVGSTRRPVTIIRDGAVVDHLNTNSEQFTEQTRVR